MSKLIEYVCIVLLIGGVVHNQIWYNDLATGIESIEQQSLENKKIAGENANAIYNIEHITRPKLRELAIEQGHGNWSIIKQLEEEIDKKKVIKTSLDKAWDAIMVAQDKWDAANRPKMDKAFEAEDADKYYALMKKRYAYHQQMFAISDSSAAIDAEISAMYTQIDSLERELTEGTPN